MIEFTMDGTIITANPLFFSTLDYGLEEIKGRHHSMFVDAHERDSAAYKAFWQALNRGDYQAGEFRRIGKDGKEVWIQASYNPVLDRRGRPQKVIKFAADITARARIQKEIDGNLGEISRAIALATRQAADA
ncbi:MAG: PAS domain-containing protein, partial [Pseudorhodoplanes sp.]|nr:PAS domain-containing protein [Pseudorhodoplanes sp.]